MSEVFEAISDFAGGGETAARELYLTLLQTAAQVTPNCAAFLIGLLQANEAERIGAGPAGFIEVQEHLWFREVDWEATLRQKIPAPWDVRTALNEADGTGLDFDEGDDFDEVDVMKSVSYEADVWTERFKALGPWRVAPWK
jgi:hypothetical protein